VFRAAYSLNNSESALIDDKSNFNASYQHELKPDKVAKNSSSWINIDVGFLQNTLQRKPSDQSHLRTNQDRSLDPMGATKTRVNRFEDRSLALNEQSRQARPHHIVIPDLKKIFDTSKRKLEMSSSRMRCSQRVSNAGDSRHHFHDHSGMEAQIEINDAGSDLQVLKRGALDTNRPWEIHQFIQKHSRDISKEYKRPENELNHRLLEQLKKAHDLKEEGKKFKIMMKDKKNDIFEYLITMNQNSKADRTSMRGEDGSSKDQALSSIRVKQKHFNSRYPMMSFDDRRQTSQLGTSSDQHTIGKTVPGASKQQPIFQVNSAKREELALIRARYSFLQSQDD
jgi:hypothetical protein